ncbi:MAG: hypothetical protein GEU80_16190 [Dehalococcoidia bacterium]|nr:hypothetical protein [Dehalococcoidia bacterium]
MTEAPPPDAAARPGRVAAADTEGWVGVELQRALARVDQLQQDMAEVTAELRAQQDEVGRLQEALHLVDGRTRRHEAGQEMAHELKQDVAGMAEQLAAESSLRRDLAAHLQRAEQREGAGQQALRQALEAIANRLERYEGHQASSELRQDRLLGDLAEQARDDQSVEARLDTLERRTATEAEAMRHVVDEVSRVAAALPDVLAGLEELRQRSRSLQVDQRRLDEDIATVRAVRDREEALLEVLDQQRATRARVEERLNASEEIVEDLRRTMDGAAEERALIGRQQAGIDMRMRSLDQRLEAQRLAMLEHLRLNMLASEEAGRREMQELERRARVQRDLLVRLAEQTQEIEREPPL